MELFFKYWDTSSPRALLARVEPAYEAVGDPVQHLPPFSSLPLARPMELDGNSQ